MKKKQRKTLNNPFSSNHGRPIPRTFCWFYRDNKRKRTVSTTSEDNSSEFEIDLTLPVFIFIVIFTFFLN